MARNPSEGGGGEASMQVNDQRLAAQPLSAPRIGFASLAGWEFGLRNIVLPS